MKTQSFRLLLLVAAATVAQSSTSRMPDGTEFRFWERPQQFSKTYYVDGSATQSDDRGPGTKERPFRTINRAAQVLQAGERVVIAEGVYRECVRPARGGAGPEKMISYEAAPGAKVVIKGSVVVKEGWRPSEGWSFGARGGPNPDIRVWELRLDPALFEGYNPFAMVNVLHNRYWINYAKYNMAPYFRRRGIVFVDGKPLEPVELPGELYAKSTRSLNFFSEAHWEPLFQEIQGEVGKVWIEHNGLALHIRLANDDSPDRHVIEITTREQVFTPAERYLSYVRVKGITFQHAGNGFPVPQRGLVSTNRGHHWIFEDNTFEWANSVGLDIGNEDWAASAAPEGVGFHVVRGNVFRYCGIEGIGGTGVPTGNRENLVEKNLFEWIGWQDAAPMAESAAMKLHSSKSLLFRNNVVRHIRHANGVWLDIGNANNRLTGNVFADIPGTVNPHAIHIEGSHEVNQVDNNVFAGLTGGLLIRDTNNVIVAQNLFLNCEDAGIRSTSGLGAPRPISGHTNDGRGNLVYNNIFHKIGRAAIEFTNAHNEAEGNAYGTMPQSGAFLRVLLPEPPEWLDLAFWQEQHGWDKTGAMAEIEASLDVDHLTLTFSVKGKLPQAAQVKGIDTDFFGRSGTASRVPGPFGDLETGYQGRNIDPRSRPSEGAGAASAPGPAKAAR